MAELLIQNYLNEGKAYYLDRAARGIRENRTGHFTVTVTDKNGVPLTGREIRLAHQVHDFDFGCNFFMYQQYETGEENRRYEEKWAKLFNTAVVPFYWEGTEPEEGYLRYAADAPNDVYRRPPAGAVVGWAKANGKRLKGHPLFWHEFIARWLPEDWETLYPLIEKRFAEISSLFGGDVPVFDCVNEPARVWNVHREHPDDGWKHLLPPDDYVKTVFDLGKRYFPHNKLILNEAVGAAIAEFHGRYSAYYLNIKDLLSRGTPIDFIGFQCHTDNSPSCRNVYDATRLYEIFDTYADFGLPMVLSEISVPSVFGGVKNEEFQAEAAEMLYSVCFSHKHMNGIFWWNLPDDGVLCTKRTAPGENLPSTGLIDGDYNEKAAYRTLDRLINHEWRTDVTLVTDRDGRVTFDGFNGTYGALCAGGEATVHLSGETGENTATVIL